MREDRVRLQGDQLFRKRFVAAYVRDREAIVDVDIAAFRPAALCKALPKRCEPRVRFRIVLREA